MPGQERWLGQMCKCFTCQICHFHDGIKQLILIGYLDTLHATLKCSLPYLVTHICTQTCINSYGFLSLC